MEDSKQIIRREIKSFVRREGRITPAQRDAVEALWPKHGLEKTQLADLELVFGRKAPCFLEIGCGTGDALIALARANPDNNYIGAEVYLPGIGSMLQAIEKYGLKNVRLVRDDAMECLRESISDQSLNGIMVFFPDPWHKKRHNKRRLIQTKFLALVIKKLKSHGRLFVGTDWQDYADHIIKITSEHPNLINLAGDEIYGPRPAWRPLTRYEKRAIRLEHVVRDFTFTSS